MHAAADYCGGCWEEGEAQLSVRERNDAPAEMRFMRDFNAIARFATDPHPQLREKLGMLERS